MKKFIPDKPFNDLPLLPPKKNLIETMSLWKLESQARAAIAELKGIAQIIPNQAILFNAVVLQEAKDSSEIENIITTNDKLYKAVTVKSQDPATKEVMFYREALNEGFRKIKAREILTSNDIADIQKILIQNDAGFRRTTGTSLINNRTGETIYTPPEGEEKINRLMGNLVEYLNDEENSLIKMAILHYQFESIHPFYDGNGRTGRIINILYLILKGYLDIPILYLSSYIIKNKQKYYELLRSVTKDENWEKWISFILIGVEETSKETIEKVLLIKKQLDTTIDLVKEQLPKIYSKELIETLFVHPYCKIEFLTQEIGIERKTASKYLKQLSKIGILEFFKVGKENIFINKKLMEILKG